METERETTEELKRASALFEEDRYEEAFEKYRGLAEKGTVTAQLLLGWLYQVGKGVQQNVAEAKKWYEKAAITQSPQAQFYLGNLFRTMGEYNQVLDWLERSAAQGYSPAIYLLGQLYYMGEGVDLDKQKASEYFKRAAEKGHLFAQRNIAYDMIKGRHGMARIPLGVLLMVRGLWQVIRVTFTDPDSDTILRL